MDTSYFNLVESTVSFNQDLLKLPHFDYTQAEVRLTHFSESEFVKKPFTLAHVNLISKGSVKNRAVQFIAAMGAVEFQMPDEVAENYISCAVEQALFIDASEKPGNGDLDFESFKKYTEMDMGYYKTLPFEFSFKNHEDGDGFLAPVFFCEEVKNNPTFPVKKLSISFDRQVNELNFDIRLFAEYAGDGEGQIDYTVTLKEGDQPSRYLIREVAAAVLLAMGESLPEPFDQYANDTGLEWLNSLKFTPEAPSL